MAFTFSPEMAPPTARWMGMDVQVLDTEAMTCTATFTTRPEMQNFGGVLQGGIIAAMLDDVFTRIRLQVAYLLAWPLKNRQSLDRH